MDCKNLESISIPDSVTTIEDAAFWGCKKLKSFTFPARLTVIQEQFVDCESLTEISIPSSVSIIAEEALYFCQNLTKIHYSGTKAEWGQIIKGALWDVGTPEYIVYCTDGTLTKKEARAESNTLTGA